jgi:predicted transglutaminase-like cysteine proteinase
MNRFAAALCAACFAVPAWAGPFLPPIEPAEPTRAGAAWCRQEPADCRIDPAEPAQIAATAEVELVIRSVNLFVNRIVEMIPDQEQWGVEDRWDLPKNGRGDCEDVALLKRQLLVERGVPRRALLMTVVLDEDGKGHAVLMVRTKLGDVILDNRRNEPRPWSRTGYTFIKRESQGGNGGWVWLGGLRDDEGAP